MTPSMEPAESSGASTPPEREPVMECCLVLTTLSGVTLNVSLSIAKFDRFADLEDHVMDYLVSVTDLKVFGCSIEFLHLATQTYYVVSAQSFFSTSTDAVWAWCPGHR